MDAAVDGATVGLLPATDRGVEGLGADLTVADRVDPRCRASALGPAHTTAALAGAILLLLVAAVASAVMAAVGAALWWWHRH